MVVSKVATPLALAGFAFAVLFLIFRQLLTLKVFSRIAGTHTTEVLKSIINKLFVLALVAMILGFVGFLIPQLLANSTPKKTAEDIIFEAIDVDSLSGDFEHSRKNPRNLAAVQQKAIAQARTIAGLNKATKKQILISLEPQAFCLNIALDACFLQFANRVKTLDDIETISDETFRNLLTKDEREAMSNYGRGISDICDEFDSFTRQLRSSVTNDEQTRDAIDWLDITNRDSEIIERIGFERCMASAARLLLGEDSIAGFRDTFYEQRKLAPNFWQKNLPENQDLIAWAMAVVNEAK
jgi:hypothetical protein